MVPMTSAVPALTEAMTGTSLIGEATSPTKQPLTIAAAASGAGTPKAVPIPMKARPMDGSNAQGCPVKKDAKDVIKNATKRNMSGFNNFNPQ